MLLQEGLAVFNPQNLSQLLVYFWRASFFAAYLLDRAGIFLETVDTSSHSTSPVPAAKPRLNEIHYRAEQKQ